MEVKVVSYISDAEMLDVVRELCSTTMGGKESKVTLEDMAYTEHSPLRFCEFATSMVEIPTFVSVHLVRHKVGVEHFVKSNRTDRGGTGCETRYTPVNHVMKLNAQALIAMARKRLCAKASPETRAVMWAIREECPEWLKPYMVAECVYRGGWCHEFKSCGFRPQAPRGLDGLPCPPIKGV